MKTENPYLRIHQVDVLRGFALLGIFWMNASVIGIPKGVYQIPNLLSEHTFLNNAFWYGAEIYIEGTMRGLFSILFGASALLFLNEAKIQSEGAGLIERYYRRNLILIFFGVFHAFILLFPYDVLYSYGLFGFFLFPLRKLSAKTLLILSMAVLLLGEINFENLVSKLPPADIVLNAAEEEAEKPDMTAEQIFKTLRHKESTEKEFYHSGYFRIFKDRFKDSIYDQSYYVYKEYLYDIGGMMLLGMALFKWGILSGNRSMLFYFILMAAGYGWGLSYRGYYAVTGLENNLNAEFFSGDYKANFTLGRVPISLGHIGLVGMLCRISILNFATGLLSYVGRMALTNYLLQSAFLIFFFYGFGLSMFGRLEHYEVGIVMISMWAFQTAFSRIWLYYFRQGPLEWVWRSMIYGKMEKLRK